MQPRKQKRPRRSGPHVVQAQPLPPGGNRFQPSASYLAAQPQVNLAPATAPSSWPPAPPVAQAHTASVASSAAARWVQDQELERRKPDSAAARRAPQGDPVAPPTPSTAEPVALRAPPSPTPQSAAILADVEYEALYGESAPEPRQPALRHPSPRPPSTSLSADSSILYADEQPLQRLFRSPSPADQDSAPEPKAAPSDFIALDDSSDEDGVESGESDGELIQKQLVGLSPGRRRIEWDSEDDVEQNGGETEVIILDDFSDGELDQPVHDSDRESSPEDPFDLVIGSDDDDEEAELLLEGDSIEAPVLEKRQADDQLAELHPKRRRLSSVEALDHQAGAGTASDLSSVDTSARIATHSATGADSTSARRTALRLWTRVFAARRAEAGDAIESPAHASASARGSPRLSPAPTTASSGPVSALMLAANPITGASGSLDAPSAPSTVQPIVMPQARDRATYQRRVDLSSTPYGTPTEVETGVRDDRGKVTYKPSPVAASVLAAAPSAQAIYFRPTHGSVVPSSSTVKGAYSRREGHPEPSTLPLSSTEKRLTISAKLLATFPSEFADLSSSSVKHVFAPAPLAITAAKALPPPNKNAHFGFWPGPPALVSGKGVFPPPRPLPGAIDPENDKRPPVHIFVDNSNVLYAFLDWIRARPESKVVNLVTTKDGCSKTTKTVTLGGRKVKLDYPTLFALLERGRRVQKRILVASSALWQSLEPAVDWGYEISLLQRVHRPAPETSATKPGGRAGKGAGRGGKIFGKPRKAGVAGKEAQQQARVYKEQAVDELIHLKMLESLLDQQPSSSGPPPTIVLVSGDAKTSEFNPTGFLGCVRRALERGWDVEVYSFAMGTSAAWAVEQARPKQEGRGSLRIIDLEQFAEELIL